MITLKQLEIYKKYNGDGDALIRCATPNEKDLMDYKHWSLIDNLVQDLFLIKKGIASTSLIKSTDEKLKECCDSEKVIQTLKDIVLI